MLLLNDILCQHILLHPFTSLRRTCQVNRRCSSFVCVQPFSLVPFMYHRQMKHGLPALYKGLSSALLAKGISMGVETGLANYIHWPREINSRRPFSVDSLKVIAIKGVSICLSTPFLSSALIETVQSVIVVKDRPSFVDCLQNGFLRLLHLKSTPSNRMLPVWLLVIPTVFYHLSHTALVQFFKTCYNVFSNAGTVGLLGFNKRTSSNRTKAKTLFDSTPQHHPHHHQNNPGSYLKQAQTLQQTSSNQNESNSEQGHELEMNNKQIMASLVASLLTDTALLPIETVLNRLYIQGTRTIIDNCDETTVVLPVLTNYEGFADCYQSIIKFEGFLGLYKGLGAIMIQYSIHFLICKSLYYMLRELQSDKKWHSTTLNRSSFFHLDSVDKGKHQHQHPQQQQQQQDSFSLNCDNNQLHSTPNSNALLHNRRLTDIKPQNQDPNFSDFSSSGFFQS